MHPGTKGKTDTKETKNRAIDLVFTKINGAVVISQVASLQCLFAF